MRITLADLNFIRDAARNFYIDRSAESRIPGEVYPLNESDRIAVGWLEASATIFRKYGFISEQDVENVKVELEIPHSESDFDQ